MLGNDSHLQSQEEADNQFLPNNSNSYESIIKEHQQRRSHILNDHLVFDAPEQSHIGKQSLCQQSYESEKTIEKLAIQQNSKLFPDDQQQNEQNQFLVNEKSLAASIKHALQSVNSKQNYSGSLHFEQNSINNENQEEQEEQEERIPHFGGSIEASILDKSNMELGNEESHPLPSNEDKSKDQEYNWNIEMERQSRHYEGNALQQSDPFRGAEKQVQMNQNEQIQQKFQMGFNQIEEKVIQHNTSNNLNVDQSLQKQPSYKDISVQKDILIQKSDHSESNIDENHHMKSRSQIEALQSVIQSNNSKLNESNKMSSEPLESHCKEQLNPSNQSSDPFAGANEQYKDQNSLSRLVNQNLYEKQYLQAEKANSSQFVVINRIISSEVEVFQVPTINRMGQNSHLKSQINQQNSIQFEQQSKCSKQSFRNSQKSMINNSRIINQSISNQKPLKQDQISEKSIVDKYDFSNNIMAQSNHRSQNNHFQEQPINIVSRKSQNHQQIWGNNPSQNNNFSERQNPSIKNQQQDRSFVNQYDFKQQPNSIKEEEEKGQKCNTQLQQQNKSVQSFKNSQKVQSRKQDSSFLQVNRSVLMNESKKVPSQKISIYKEKSFQVNPSKLSQSKRSVIQNIKLRNIEPSEAYSIKSSKKQASQKESQIHLPYIQNKRRQSELINGLKASSNFSKQSSSIKVQQGSKISSKGSKYSVQSKHHSSNIQKNPRDKIVSYSQGLSQQLETRIYLPQMQPGSTGIESKSTFTKKKQENNKEIFNTYPATFQVESFDQIGAGLQQSRKDIVKEQQQQQGREKMKTIGSPSKQRETQIERVRVLKENHRKRLQRELQKVKKQLQEINSWEKNMQKIYEEKQKLQNKQKQKALITKEKESQQKRSNKLSRQNEVILKIIKDHRKSKEQITVTNENSEDLTKNLAQLVNLRNQAQEKLKQQKRQQIAQRMKRNQSRRLQQQKLIKVNNHYIKQFKSAEGSVVSPTKNIQPKIDKLINYKGSKYPGNIRQRANPYQEKLD